MVLLLLCQHLLSSLLAKEYAGKYAQCSKSFDGKARQALTEWSQRWDHGGADIEIDTPGVDGLFSL
jgi:hypothetical protein